MFCAKKKLIYRVTKQTIGLAAARSLTRSGFRLNLLLLKGQRCMPDH